MHVQVSASAGDVGGRHLDERHDCEQHGDNGNCDERAGEPGDGSGRAGETAGGGGGRGRWATPRPRSSRPRAVAGSTGCLLQFPVRRGVSAVTPRSRPRSPSPTGTGPGSSSSPPWPGRSRFRPASPQMGDRDAHQRPNPHPRSPSPGARRGVGRAWLAAQRPRPALSRPRGLGRQRQSRPGGA
jgi:hypothetical protein